MESVDSTSEVVAEPNDIGERNADEECDDGEYEETYLYVDFETKLLEEQLMNPNLQIKVLGVDTDAPIVQLNNKIFKGTTTNDNNNKWIAANFKFLSGVQACTSIQWVRCYFSTKTVSRLSRIQIFRNHRVKCSIIWHKLIKC